jgi:DNA modification methylase
MNYEKNIQENFAKIMIGDSRKMFEIEDESVDLIITSPPYWHIKDYGVPGQIGYGQDLHQYLKDIYYVWMECFRVLRKGGRFCLNIGDQFARSVIYGRYKIIPIHAEFILQCEKIGFDFMGSIIWQKKTTMNTTGGANVMGSFPYPPNGMIEIDYEFILIFKKPGHSKKVSKDIKEVSKLTKEEWKQYFSGHWYFKGARQIEHEAMFPDELPKRLIKMFSFVDDTVLDPFLGSGTTIKVALELNRNGIGYEINKDFLKLIKKKIDGKGTLEIIERNNIGIELPEIDYVPTIQNIKTQIDPKKFNFRKERTYRVIEIIDEETIKLDTGLKVKLLGLKVNKREDAIDYLRKYVLGKEVFLRFDNRKNKISNQDTISAYVYLKNKIFINKYLIKSGIALPQFIFPKLQYHEDKN